MKDYSPPDLGDIELPAALLALADPCRMAIVHELLRAEGDELSCSDIPLEVSKATRSHHFDVLFNAGLIAKRPAGTKCMTSLRTKEINRRFPGLLALVAAAAP